MIEVENKTAQEMPVESQKRYKNKKMSIRKAYVLLFCIILTFCSLCAVLQLTNSVSAAVTVNSIFSADGQNPDGTPFSIVELFNDDIMNSAVQKLDETLSVQELRSHLTVSDLMTGTSFSQLEKSIFNGENENTYFPTEYLLTYSTITEQIQNEGFIAQCKALLQSFSLPAKTEILSAVLQSYQEYYAETYLNYDSLFEIDWSVVDSMDYYNRFEFMEDTIARLMRFLEYKNTGSILQSGSNSNTDYYDLTAELAKGPAHAIEDYQAYITQNGVTNNKEALLRQFVYMQKLSEEENARKMQEYNVLKEAIEMYDSTTTKVVFIPALDNDEAFYMNRTKVGLDYLSEKADAAKLQADSAKYASKQYSYLQTCFGAEYLMDENGEETQNKNTTAQRAHADELYESLKKEIQQLITQTALLTSDGKQANHEALTISEPFGNISMISVGISFAKRFAVLTLAVYVVLCGVSVLFGKRRKGYRG